MGFNDMRFRVLGMRGSSSRSAVFRGVSASGVVNVPHPATRSDVRVRVREREREDHHLSYLTCCDSLS